MKDWNSPIYVFFKKPYGLNILETVDATFLNVLWVDAKHKMGGMFITSSTKETGS